MASTTVARTQPDVDAPHTTSVSRPASIDANGTPKNADACALTMIGSSSRRPSRSSISTQRVPGRSTFSAGHLAQEDRRGGLPDVVVDDRGEEDRHAAPPRRVEQLAAGHEHVVQVARERRRRVGEAVVEIHDDDGGALPEPRRAAEALSHCAPGPGRLPVLQRRPPQRLRRRRRRQPGLGLAVRDRLLHRRPEVERLRVAALRPLPRALGLRGLGIADDHAVRRSAPSRPTRARTPRRARPPRPAGPAGPSSRRRPRSGRSACRPARRRSRRTWPAAPPRSRRRAAGSSSSARPAARRARPTAASASGRRGSRRAPAPGTRSASRPRCRRGASPAPPESVTVV